MTIPVFRATRERLLTGLPPATAIEAKRRIQLTLEVLNTEVMSQEGMAIIISQVVHEHESNN